MLTTSCTYNISKHALPSYASNLKTEEQGKSDMNTLQNIHPKIDSLKMVYRQRNIKICSA